MKITSLIADIRNLSLTLDGKLYVKKANVHYISLIFNRIFKLNPSYKELKEYFNFVLEKGKFEENLVLLWSLITNDISPLKELYNNDENTLNKWINVYYKTLNVLAYYRISDLYFVDALFGDYDSCEKILEKYNKIKTMEKMLIPKKPPHPLISEKFFYHSYFEWLVKILDYKKNSAFYINYPWKVYKS